MLARLTQRTQLHMHSLERKTFLPEWRLFGLDSIQGYLEMPEWYSKDHVRFFCEEKDRSRFGSMFFQLLQLEKEGFLIIEWVPSDDDGREMHQLKQVSLTVDGHKLLNELKGKSRSVKMKERLITLFWAIITSTLTTLIVIALKGK